MAAIGLGAVIFVHELGHFAVAKWCGVRCDKFYLGFDIYGLKLFKLQWGETEYGIGILPLGGYVKMLGQDDNPENQAQEFAQAQANGGLDPRSYLAKSVPQRMAIISAGVIMNLIFAFIFLVWAYVIGVDYMPCEINAVEPGSPAWVADFRSGDEVTKISGIEKPRFDQDLMQRVTLADLDQGVTFDVHRPGENAPITKVVKPRHSVVQRRPTIGLGTPNNLDVMVGPTFQADAKIIADAFHQATPAFEMGDKIVSVGGVAVKSIAEVESVFVTKSADDLEVVVNRVDAEASKGKTEPVTKQVTIKLPKQPTKRIGVVMEMTPIVAVQEGSPAQTAGLKAGDKLFTIDGQPVGDPLTFADRVRKLGTKKVSLGIERDKQPQTVEVALREATWHERPLSGRGNLSAPSLGIAFGASHFVAAVVPGSPAEKVGITPGTEITGAEIVYSGEAAKFIADKKAGPFRYMFAGDAPVRWFWQKAQARLDPLRIDWPMFEAVQLQEMFNDGKVILTSADHKTYELTPEPAKDQFEVDRGLVTGRSKRTRTAESFGEALSLGWRDTKEDVLMVYRFLQKLTSGQVSPMLMRGVLTIGQVAYYQASSGLSSLLVFLAMLSANLAVVNFLPIPVLDGGHFVFLSLEGLRGKPVSERVVVAFHWLGLCFILSLMVFVLGLDVTDLLTR
jgi:regulator of sigma E protease